MAQVGPTRGSRSMVRQEVQALSITVIDRPLSSSLSLSLSLFLSCVCQNAVFDYTPRKGKSSLLSSHLLSNGVMGDSSEIVEGNL